MLICKFASERSAPARIRNYLSYLTEVEQKHLNDSQAQQLLEKLRLEAQSWIGKRELS